MSEFAGTVLRGRYRIGEKLSEGGLFDVYAAVDESSNGHPVAAKRAIIDGFEPDEQQALQLHLATAMRAVSTVRHRSLPRVHDVDGPWLITDRVHGLPLHEHLNRRPDPYAVADVLRWAESLCELLHLLHTQTPPLLLLDLNPSNLMIDRDGAVYQVGLGLLRPHGGRPPGLLHGAGTPGYASPEQLGQLPLDPRSDIYSLGATLYALLTRRPPPDALALASGHEVLAPPSRWNAEVPPHLDESLRRLMAPRPEQRPASAQEAWRALLTPSVAPVVSVGPLLSSPPTTSPVVSAGAPISSPPATSPALPPASTSISSRLVTVLFIDVASYATYRNDEQQRLRSVLRGLIDAVPYLSTVAPGDVHVDLRAGDSGVVVFSNDVAGPIEAAMYLTEATREPVDGLPIRLRLGLHVGTAFFDEQGQAVGEALNMGQRVAASGQAGDTTSSQAYADMLTSDTSRYDDLLGPPRSVEIKHGKRLSVRRVAPGAAREADAQGPATAPPATSPSAMPPPAPRWSPPAPPAGGPMYPGPQSAPPPAASPAVPPAAPFSGTTLVITGGAQVGRRIPLPAASLEIGRGDAPAPSASRVEIAEKTISRVQAMLQYDPSRRTFRLVHNPGATNATAVNDAVVTERMLQHGDVVRAGQLSLVVESVAPPSVQATEEWRVGALPPRAALDVDSMGARGRYPLASALTRVGRVAPCELVIDDPALSRLHLSIHVQDGRFVLQHESRTNVTLVNGIPVTAPRVLAPGDEIRVSDRTVLRFTPLG